MYHPPAPPQPSVLSRIGFGSERRSYPITTSTSGACVLVSTSSSLPCQPQVQLLQELHQELGQGGNKLLLGTCRGGNKPCWMCRLPQGRSSDYESADDTSSFRPAPYPAGMLVMHMITTSLQLHTASVYPPAMPCSCSSVTILLMVAELPGDVPGAAPPWAPPV
jgi:hypothetical protein